MTVVSITCDFCRMPLVVTNSLQEAETKLQDLQDTGKAKVRINSKDQKIVFCIKCYEKHSNLFWNF